ncbi:MAG: RNA-binding domain-containing protein, partial [Bacteroidota bacterium]
MLSKEEIKELLLDLESDRMERTISIREDKIGEAVCSFSNDYPNHKRPGYIFLGVNDDGSIAGMTIGDGQLQTIGGIRANGNILPQPSLTVSDVHKFDEGDVVVIEVFPSFHPPVRFKGKCCIRIGPRKALANEAEERRLSEKRTSTAKTFDARPFPNSRIEDLDINMFKSTYLPQAIDKETL